MVAPGDTVELEIVTLSGAQLSPTSTLAELAHRTAKVNPVTGPVSVAGAEPGDALKVTILSFASVRLGLDRQHPGIGLLADQFPEPALQLWRYDPASLAPAVYGPGGRVPLKPFAGTIGLAPAEPGLHSIVFRPGAGATWTSATSPLAPSSTCRSRSRAVCSRSATPTRHRATARSAVRQSRPDVAGAAV